MINELRHKGSNIMCSLPVSTINKIRAGNLSYYKNIIDDSSYIVIYV